MKESQTTRRDRERAQYGRARQAGIVQRHEAHGRGRGSLGLFARTLFAVLAERVDEYEGVVPNLSSERGFRRWCWDVIHDRIGTPFDRRFWRALKAYQEAGLIHRGRHQVRLTPKGRVRWRQYQVETLRLERPKVWDGRWRILIWDVPEKQRQRRDALRHVLVKLGFAQVQRSVWIIPWPCQSEIEFLREQFSLGPSLLAFEAQHIDGEQHLRDHFNL